MAYESDGVKAEVTRIGDELAKAQAMMQQARNIINAELAAILAIGLTRGSNGLVAVTVMAETSATRLEEVQMVLGESQIELGRYRDRL